MTTQISKQSQLSDAWFDGRLLVIVFALLFSAALLWWWANKSEESRRTRRAAKIQTESLLRAYGKAAKDLVAECGYERVSSAKIPNVFTNDPGWDGWKGPYLRGDIRSGDYYGTPVRFLFSNYVFFQVSAGVDRKFDTPDDITEATPLR